MNELNTFSYDGDNVMATNAPENVVEQVWNTEMPEECDEGSLFYARLLNELGYEAVWVTWG